MCPFSQQLITTHKYICASLFLNVIKRGPLLILYCLVKMSCKKVITNEKVIVALDYILYLVNNNLGLPMGGCKKSAFVHPMCVAAFPLVLTQITHAISTHTPSG